MFGRKITWQFDVFIRKLLVYGTMAGMFVRTVYTRSFTVSNNKKTFTYNNKHLVKLVFFFFWGATSVGAGLMRVSPRINMSVAMSFSNS